MSITLIALVLGLLGRRERRIVLPLCAAAGVLLIATTVGRPSVDLYSPGFSPLASLLLAALGIVAAPRFPRLAVLALAIVVAHEVALFPSRNLFDYAFDPLLTVIAVVWGAGVLVRRGLRGRLQPAH